MPILIVSLQYILVWLIIKIFRERLNFSKLEFLLMILNAIFVGFMYLVVNVYTSIFLAASTYCLQYYFSRDKLNSVIATCYSMIILVISDHLSSLFSINFGILNMDIEHLSALTHIGISYVLAITICVLMVVLKHRVKNQWLLDPKIKLLIAVLGAFIIFSYYMCIYLSNYLGNGLELIQLNAIFFIIYIVISLFIFYLYSSSLKKIYYAKQMEIEFSSIMHYTEEIEKQYTEMRKFRHDYQNILSSLDSFIEEGDFEGLKKYYEKNIKIESEHITKRNFNLENLRSIKIREIKSILSSKLITAQEYGIDAKFEAKEDIHYIPMNSLVLVRVIGILLDNAIDELKSLGYGQLLVGLIKDKDSILFIVQNTCHKDIPKLHILKKQGFSTKGENRGLGLSNLSDMIQKCENVVLETVIKEQLFIQKVVISLEV